MSKIQNAFRKLGRSLIVTFVGASAVLLMQAPGTPASAALPQLSSVSPNSGSTLGGQRIVIQVGQQINDQLPVTVTIDGNSCIDEKVIDNGFRIGCTVPPGTVGAKSVVVTSNSQSNPANTFFNYYEGPNSPEIVDIVRDSVAETFSIYFNPPTSGPAPTSYRVNSCGSDFDVQSTTSPLVVTYAQACSGYGGYAGWLNSNPTFAANFSLKAVNASGPSGSSAWFPIKAEYASAPRITNVSPTKYGCMVDFALPTVVPNGVTISGVLASDEQDSSSAAGISSYSIGQTTGRLFLRQLPAGYGVWLSDGKAVLKFTYLGFNDFSLPSAEFECLPDPNMTVSAPSQPTMTVTPGDGKFTVNWSVTSSGSSPIDMAYMSVVQLSDDLGPFTLPAWMDPAEPAIDVQYVYNTCTGPSSRGDCTYLNSFMTPSGRTVNSKWTYQSEIGMQSSGSFDVTALYDPQQGQFSIPVVNGRTYVVYFWVSNFEENNDTAGTSLGAEYAVVNPAAAPTVTAISPSSGYAAGGTSVDITGTNFANGSTVTIGGAACTNVSVVSATRISCVTPAGTVGSGSVVVTSAGASNAANALYSYTANPAVSPSTQTVSGTAGTAVAASTAFTPNNFTGAVSYAVTSGTLPAGLAISSSTGVISGTPTAASSATVTVTATGATAGSATATVTFAIVAAPATTTTIPATTTTTPATTTPSTTTAPATATTTTTTTPATTTTTPPTTAPATTTAPSGPANVTASNQATLTRTPGAATALVNGQPVSVAVETPADLPAAQVDPEDRSPAQVQSLQVAADNLVDQLNQAAGGNSGLAVQDTPTGAAITGLLTTPVPIENTVLVEAANKSTLFAALNEDGSVTEVQPGAVIEVLGDGQVGVVASGLTPGETAEFVIMSTPTLLGSYTVSANGTIKAQTSLPDGIGLGNHTLVVASPTVQASLGLKVSATPSTLPATGASSSNTMQIALFLMVGGSMVAFLRRRRHILN